METLYVLTGATSHLGQALIRDLIATNKKVRVLIHKTMLPSSIRDYPIEIVQGSILDIETLRELLTYEGDLVLIHCAGRFEVGEEVTESMFQVNIKGTQNIIDMCFEMNVKKLLFLSSSQTLRQPESLRLLSEVQYFRPEGVSTGYGKSKAEATQMVLDAGKTGLNVNVFLPSTLIGPYDYRGGLSGRLITDFLQNKIKFLIKGGLDFVDVRDVSQAILNAAEISRPQEVYLLTGKYMTLHDFITEVARATRRKRINLFMPDFLSNSVESISRINKFFNRRDFYYSKQLIGMLMSQARFSSNKAVQYLGYETRPLVDSIVDTVQFYVDMELLDKNINLRVLGKNNTESSET